LNQKRKNVGLLYMAIDIFRWIYNIYYKNLYSPEKKTGSKILIWNLKT